MFLVRNAGCEFLEITKFIVSFIDKSHFLKKWLTSYNFKNRSKQDRLRQGRR